MDRASADGGVLMSKRKPCESCPWRKSTQTEDIPGGGLDHVKIRGSGSAFGKGNGFGPGKWGVMSCHLSSDDKPFVCAGFVLQVGMQSQGVRLAQAMGVLDVAEFTAGGLELHETMEELMEAHPDNVLR